MATGGGNGAGGERLGWLDIVKGIAILAICLFHYFEAANVVAYPSPIFADYAGKFLEVCRAEAGIGTAGCAAWGVLVLFLRLAFHGVAVFLVLSGFGLGLSAAKSGRVETPKDGWLEWYRKRLLRLFPMYWLAHVVCALSPIAARPEAIDGRFLLSFLGDRIWPIESIFYYLNPAWWYFGLLIQLYLLFPILWMVLEKVGVSGFLAFSALVTFGARAIMLLVWPTHGYWVQGGFFASRLWEFALGVAAGVLWRRHPKQFAAVLDSRLVLVGALGVYILGILSYRSLPTYVFSDALTGSALAFILAAVARSSERLPGIGLVAAAGAFSYGLYLLHQPHVIWLGEHLRGYPAGIYLPAGAGFIALLAWIGTALEKQVNTWSARALG